VFYTQAEAEAVPAEASSKALPSPTLLSGQPMMSCACGLHIQTRNTPCQCGLVVRSCLHVVDVVPAASTVLADPCYSLASTPHCVCVCVLCVLTVQACGRVGRPLGALCLLALLVEQWQQWRLQQWQQCLKLEDPRETLCLLSLLVAATITCYVPLLRLVTLSSVA